MSCLFLGVVKGGESYIIAIIITLFMTSLMDSLNPAAIVLTKKYNVILASNNFKDLVFYINLYNLKYISTSEIIYKAYKDEIISLNKAKSLWKEMIKKRRKLPFKTFKTYLKKHQLTIYYLKYLFESPCLILKIHLKHLYSKAYTQYFLSLKDFFEASFLL